MPLLSSKSVLAGALPRAFQLRVHASPTSRDIKALDRTETELNPVCANPSCSSGWLRRWRARPAAIFESGSTCSPFCTRAVMRAAVVRELKGMSEADVVHQHRVPLGLLLLSQGAITREQLRGALGDQRARGGRLGEWLQRSYAIEERMITRALGSQWGCPVLTLDNHIPERVAALVPRLLLDAFGILPLRQAGAALLYVGFEDRIDRCVHFAIERMTGVRVEAGVVDGSAYAEAHRRLLAVQFPPARMVEAAGADALVATFTRILEETRPVDARLVRMRDYFWLRLWTRREAGARPGCAEDVLGSLAGSRA